MSQKTITLKDRLKAAQAELLAIQTKATAEGRDFTKTESETIERLSSDAADFKLGIERAEKSRKSIAALVGDEEYDSDAPDRLHGGSKSFFALAGDRGRKAASGIAAQMKGGPGTKAFPTSGQLLSNQVFTPDPVDTQKIPTTIVSLLPIVARDSSTWEGLRQTGFTSNASIVPAGATKPTTTISLERITRSLSVLAHLSEPTDKFVLEDNSHLIDFVHRNMLFGLEQALEEEVLNGDGSTFKVDNIDAKHFTGILHTIGVQQQAFVGDQLVTLRSASAKLEASGFNSDAYIVNGNDWATIESRRNTSGQFDLGAAVELAERRAWGTRVVTSTRIPTGTAVALDLTALNIDTDRAGVRIAWDASGSLFDKNQMKARVEGRFNLSVERPEGIVVIDLEQPEADG